ncbi:MAG: hypothetical protein ACYCUD_12530 [Candidatus Dormibacteria bacterium]
METRGVRELRGETLRITARGRLVAVTSASSGRRGAAALVASGRAQQPRLGPEFLPEPELGLVASWDVLHELRAERV